MKKGRHPVSGHKRNFAQRSTDPIGTSINPQELSATELIIGRNPCREAVLHCPERIKKIFAVEASDDSDQAYFELLGLIAEKGLKINYVGHTNELTRLVQSEAHQGIVLSIERRPSLELKQKSLELLSRPSSLIVVLDEIGDPQNLGSILRASECFGVDTLVWSKNRGVSLTPSAAKASVGASVLVENIAVSNIVDALGKLKTAGHWIIGADVCAESTSINDFEFPAHSVLVLGSEGEGLKRLVKDTLDFRIYIPMFGKIDSLNVGQAAAVMLYAYRRCLDKNSNLK